MNICGNSNCNIIYYNMYNKMEKVKKVSRWKKRGQRYYNIVTFHPETNRFVYVGKLSKIYMKLDFMSTDPAFKVKLKDDDKIIVTTNVSIGKHRTPFQKFYVGTFLGFKQKCYKIKLDRFNTYRKNTKKMKEKLLGKNEIQEENIQDA